MPLNKLPRTKLTLAKRTATLCTLLTKSASEYQVLKAAGRVRDARIQVLRATIGSMPSPLRTAEQNRRIAKIGDQIELLRSTAPVAILAEFRLARQKAGDES